MSFFEQIADMPRNRGCLSWDGVKEREKRDARKAWEREEGGRKQEQRDGQEDLRLCKRNTRQREER